MSHLLDNAQAGMGGHCVCVRIAPYVPLKKLLLSS